MERLPQHTKMHRNSEMLPPKFTNPQPLHPGKSAEVFKAQNSLTGRPVFLKKYPIPPLDALSALREPQLLTALEHENLVKIYSADVVDNDYVRLEMEFVDGGSFQNLIDEAGNTGKWPSVHECIRLVADVAAGLSHLASNGFVHRDVKPANLLIRGTSDRKQGVVTDLGLVTRLNDAGRAFATKHARIYRPPEVWAGNGYSEASDVYQLAIVLFQLLGGHLDHELGNLDDAQLAALAAQSKIISIESMTADVGPDLRKVIKNAIADEGSRYSSMSEFVVALGKAKLKESDWTFAPTNDGYFLSRTEGVYSYRVKVTYGQDGMTHVVKRFKAKNQRDFRQKLPSLTFKCKNLSVHKPFRDCLKW
jgi:eukaryotic-like serine/threonine-protein kinase